ncbi:MAG: lipoxygenase [Alphaproteobacteria bacterium]|nr:lipoxygenase [Alphaproteobacteria bacterium]
MSESLSRRELLAAAAALAAVSPFAPACRPKPGALSLPGEGLPDPQRLAALEAAREAYRYDYAKPNLRGVALCDTLPPTETPSAAWVERVVETLTRLGENNARTMGAPPPDPAALTARMMTPGANPAAVASEIAVGAVSMQEGRAERLADFKAQFAALPEPPDAQRIHDDADFARLRLAGPNPCWIRQVSPRDGLPEDFGVTAELARAGLAEGDELGAALSEGRLFLCSYRELLEVETGSARPPDEVKLDYDKDPEAWDAAYAKRERAYRERGRPKTRIAPLALFAVPPGGGALRPVAIQALPNGTDGQSYPVFTPADGVAWRRAKSMVNAADATVYELTTHLALTHLVQEAFALAMHNGLAPMHPLNALLLPHFEGTMLINNAADATLVDSDSPVDRMLLPTMGGGIRIAAKALKAFHVRDAALPRQLELRGVADPALITDYPYRDDGLLVWDSLRAWVAAYVGRYYSADAVVAGDAELQDFVTQIGLYKQEVGGRLVGGGLSGVGPVRSVDALVELVTGIVFNGSAQHAAVNFPQAGPLLYAPRMPLAMYGPLPSHEDEEDAWLAQLPDLSLSRLQATVTFLLGATRHTELGRYAEGTFKDAEVRAALSQLQGRLADVEATIDERNGARRSYPYLKPSLIPQSINI